MTIYFLLNFSQNFKLRSFRVKDKYNSLNRFTTGKKKHFAETAEKLKLLKLKNFDRIETKKMHLFLLYFEEKIM